MRTISARVVLFAFVLLALAPAAAHAQSGTPAAAPEQAAQPLTIFTPYPSQVIGLDETVSLPLTVRAASPQTVALSLDGAPDGWNVSFRGGNRTVSSVFADGQKDATVDLRVEPAGATPGRVYTFTVVAEGATETSRLPVELAVQEKAPPKLTLETDLPTLRGKSSTSFRYNVTLKNEGADDLDVNLTADAPPSFLVDFSLNGQNVTAVPVATGETKRLNVEAKALNDVAAADYPITIHAQSTDASAQLDLTAEVIGQPDLQLTTPDGRVSAEANAGKPTTVNLVLANPGSAAARNITVSATAPTGWDVKVEPGSVPELAPGQSVDVKATIQPGDNVINGDYVVTFSARSEDTPKQDIDMRVTVKTSTLWGVGGIALIALSVGVVVLAVGRFGRR